MRIISWNTNGLRARIKDGTMAKVLEMDADVLCFQETKLSDNTIFAHPLFSGYSVTSRLSVHHGRSGVAILSKIRPDAVFDSCGYSRADIEGRYLKIKIGDLQIISLYMPHGKRDKGDLPYKLDFSQHLVELLKEQSSNKVLVCTDFNIAHKDVDLARPAQNRKNVMFTSEEREIINQLSSNHFFDAYRTLNPNGTDYSWWPYAFQAYLRNVGWRIDYFFVSKPLLSRITESQILKEIRGSDHAPIILSMDL